MVDNENADFIILDETHGTNKKEEIEQFHDTYKSVAINDLGASRRSPLLHVSFPQQINEMLPLDNGLVDICAASQAQLNCAKDMAEKIDEEEKIHLDSSSLHPSFESILLDKKSVLKQDDVQVRPLPDPLVCTAREYCEHHVFPTLLPAMQEMLIEAKENKVFEKRRTKFNACDYLTNYLYSHNPKFSNRDGVKLEDIPFVQKILAENPRPPIPSSLLLSDDEAATIIQAHYKGYKVRKHPEVQELRQYQKEMREEDCEINFKVADLWKKYSMEDIQ